jgi:hypothetical protein
MVLHYTINVWPPVLALVFPDVHMNTRGSSGWVSTALMAVITLAFTIYFWPRLTQAAQPKEDGAAPANPMA